MALGIPSKTKYIATACQLVAFDVRVLFSDLPANVTAESQSLRFY